MILVRGLDVLLEKNFSSTRTTKLHRRVIVVQYQHAVEMGRFVFGFDLGDDRRRRPARPRPERFLVIAHSEGSGCERASSRTDGSEPHHSLRHCHRAFGTGVGSAQRSRSRENREQPPMDALPAGAAHGFSRRSRFPRNPGFPKPPIFPKALGFPKVTASQTRFPDRFPAGPTPSGSSSLEIWGQSSASAQSAPPKNGHRRRPAIGADSWSRRSRRGLKQFWRI